MRNDEWITLEEAKQILNGLDLKIEKLHKGRFLGVLNECGIMTSRTRIYDGSEHILARRGMLLKDSVEKILPS